MYKSPTHAKLTVLQQSSERRKIRQRLPKVYFTRRVLSLVKTLGVLRNLEYKGTLYSHSEETFFKNPSK